MSQATQDRADFRFLFGGFSSLLVVAFLDNARGPLIPVLLRQLAIPYETAGLFLTVGNLAAIAATFLLGRALQRWGERRVSIWVCFLAMLPGLLAPWVDGRLLLLLLGILLGASVALLGSLCSILTVKGSPRSGAGPYVSLQQVMYGVGSLIGPLLFQALIAMDKPWWWLLTAASGTLFLLGLSFIFILPPSPPQASSAISSTEAPLQLRNLLVILMFACYVGGEVLASMWMSSLLVAKQGKDPAEAARYLMYFFILLATTRFMCFLWVRPRHETKVIAVSLVLGISMSLLGQSGQSWALPAMGILGPFFPLCMARLSLRFPDNWRQMMIYVYGGMQITLALMHVTVGRVADHLGLDVAFYLSPLFLCGALALFLATPHFRRAGLARA